MRGLEAENRGIVTTSHTPTENCLSAGGRVHTGTRPTVSLWNLNTAFGALLETPTSQKDSNSSTGSSGCSDEWMDGWMKD